MSDLTFFIFAGRRANMDIQRPLLMRLLDKYPHAQLHLWDMTRTVEDQRYLAEYVKTAPVGRVTLLGKLHPGFPPNCLYPGAQARPRGWRRCECILHKPPYEKPYQYYAKRGNADALYVKIDDDVLFLETERFDDMLAPLAEHPNRVISANVINNAVCAKYEPSLLASGAYDTTDPTDPRNDHWFWELHTSAWFARHSHDWFLASGIPFAPVDRPVYTRTRPGEAISINCIAFAQPTMNRLARAFASNPRLGDEGVVDSYLPWIARTCYAAHLTFGPQDKDMELAELRDLREAYFHLGVDYLAQAGALT